MKKLIAFFLISVMLFTAAACACGAQQQTVTHRGEITVYCDNALTTDLLTYFQANQDCLVTCEVLNAETDYEALSSKTGVALVKDEAVAQKLRDAGWTETEDWTNAQKEKNEQMFGFTVLLSPKNSDTGRKAAKLLTDWLVGDGSYERTVTTVSGGCGCRREQTTVTITSDAGELVKDAHFAKLVNP